MVQRLKPKAGPKPRLPGSGPATPSPTPASVQQLRLQFAELQKDALVMAKALSQEPARIGIMGTARSQTAADGNGNADYRWVDALSEVLYHAGESLVTGGGPGAMESGLRGHWRQSELRRLGKAAFPPLPPLALGWRERAEPSAQSPVRLGGNIVLPFEQKPNPFIEKLSSYERFVFRMTYLFGTQREQVITPGGFGTVAELLSLLEIRKNSPLQDSVFFGAPDDFFAQLNGALSPLLEPAEAQWLGPSRIATHPNEMLHHLKKRDRSKDPAEDPGLLAKRMLADLKVGFEALEQVQPGVSFVAGSGPSSKKAQDAMRQLGQRLSAAGIPLRANGAPAAIEAASSSASGSATPLIIRRHSSEDSPAQGKLLEVGDFLVQRELLAANARGMVVVPDGLEALAALFVTACDQQSHELPLFPLVVLDPEGHFEKLCSALESTMLSSERRYINPEDLQLFKVTSDPEEAARWLLAYQPDPSAPMTKPAPAI